MKRLLIALLLATVIMSGCTNETVYVVVTSTPAALPTPTQVPQRELAVEVKIGLAPAIMVLGDASIELAYNGGSETVAITTGSSVEIWEKAILVPSASTVTLTITTNTYAKCTLQYGDKVLSTGEVKSNYGTLTSNGDTYKSLTCQATIP